MFFGQNGSKFALQILYFYEKQNKGALIMPKETIMSKISDEDFVQIVKSSKTYKEIAYKCGYSNMSGASSNIVKNRIKKMNLDFQSSQPEAIVR